MNIDTNVIVIIVLILVILYSEYSRLKLRNLVLELEYAVEKLHEKVEEHEGIIEHHRKSKPKNT